jgi:hypothetical protein
MPISISTNSNANWFIERCGWEKIIVRLASGVVFNLT